MKKQYFILYKITCLLNNKIYIGQHRTTNPEDNYFGSAGALFQNDLQQFGKENFKKEILRYCVDAKDLDNWEAKIVNEEFVAREDTYNCQLGGQWELDKWSDAGHHGFKQKWDADEEFRKALGEKRRQQAIINNYANLMNEHNKINGHPWIGRKHNDESKKKIGKANSRHQSGTGNSNYGNCWIHNLELKESKSIPKSDLQKWLKQGWIKGRKIKFMEASIHGDKRP